MEFITENLTWILAAAVLILGLVIANVAAKYKPVLQKLREALELYKQFKEVDSEGGRKLTHKEKDQLLDAIGELLQEALGLVSPKGIWKTIKGVFN